MIKRAVVGAWIVLLFSCATSGAAQLPKVEAIENFTPQKQAPAASAAVIDESAILNEFAEGDIVSPGSGGMSGRKHQGAVLCLEAGPSSTFFSGGADGFLAEHTESSVDSFWQISDLAIRRIAVHPEGNYIAVYETDGFYLHRVSVWNWETKQRLYAKRFKDAVVSLSWSAKGTWLIAGNTSIDGVAIFSGISGESTSIFRKSPGIVSLAITGDSETSMITYGPSGRIAYTDIATGNERAVFQGIPELQFPVLFSNNKKIAGFKEGQILVQDATTGKTVTSHQSGSPYMLTGRDDSNLYWIEAKDSGLYSFRSEERSGADFKLPDNSYITAVLSVRGSKIIGTSSGAIYNLIADEAYSVSLSPMEAEGISRIDDIASDGSRLFLLSAGSLFISTGAGNAPVFSSGGFTGNKIAVTDFGLIDWSTKEPSAIMLRSIDGEISRMVATVAETVKSISVNGRLLTLVEGSRLARVIDLESGKELYSYSGAGFQEALMITDSLLCISKSSTLRSPNPLLAVNTSTGETVPLPVFGELCYGLKQTRNDPTVLGAFLINSNESKTTELIGISINLSTITASASAQLAVYPDEDLTASVNPSDEGIFYTTLGKNSLVEIDYGNKKQHRFERAFALPAKSTELDQFIACLNFDGSISWYDKSSKKLLSTATINESGFWMEYPE